MTDDSPTEPVPDPAVDRVPVRPERTPSRSAALLQVLAICGMPTQIVIALVLNAGFGMPIFTDAGYSLEFMATLSLLDTAAILLLIRLFLWQSDEPPVPLFIGPRPAGGEALRGLALVPVVYVGVAALVLLLRAVAPWMHTVEHNPLETFLGSTTDAGVFLVVVVIAGGVREEIQRAFILHRFEQRLGGVKVGLALFSVAFGALHAYQGLDVAITIGILGLIWGVLFVTRRSAVLPMVNHAGFNALQVVQGFVARSLGG